MSSAVLERPLRASEIPQMVDVDGHIEEQLLRYGQGVTVRAMFQEIPLEDFEYSPDAYVWCGAEEYLPQPPRALEDWERELHGLPVAVCPCGCGLASTVPGFTAAPGQFWIVPTVENPAAPTLRELQRGVVIWRDPVTPWLEALQELAEWERELLNPVPQRVVVGFDGSRSGNEIIYSITDETFPLPAVDLTPFQEQINRAQVELSNLEPIRFQLDRWVPSRPLDPDEVRERALSLRRNRNTGPEQVAFRHRGQR